MATMAIWRMRRSSSKTTWLMATLAAFVLLHAVSLWTVPMALRPEPRLCLSERLSIAARYTLPLPANSSGSVGVLRVAKKIHFVHSSYLLYAHLKPLLSSWRSVYPDYRMYFWTVSDVRLLVSLRYFDWREEFDRFDFETSAKLLAAARAFVLHAVGGWYADFDIRCLSRADRDASWHSLILPLEPYLQALADYGMLRLVSGAIMYSVPGHPFWLFYLHQLQLLKQPGAQKINNDESVASTKPRTTGSVLLTDAALMFQQAHQQSGACPGPWCPHLAPPVLFLPAYQSSSTELRHRLRLVCSRLLHQVDSAAEFKSECRLFQKQDLSDDFKAHQTESRTARRMQESSPTDPMEDVRTWNLGLVHGLSLRKEILAELGPRG